MLTTPKRAGRVLAVLSSVVLLVGIAGQPAVAATSSALCDIRNSSDYQITVTTSHPPTSSTGWYPSTVKSTAQLPSPPTTVKAAAIEFYRNDTGSFLGSYLKSWYPSYTNDFTLNPPYGNFTPSPARAGAKTRVTLYADYSYSTILCRVTIVQNI